LVFSRGEIVEDGSHRALLARKGHYHQLWTRQSGGLLPEDLGAVVDGERDGVSSRAEN
jgi:ATP-binding cassette, subfamily B, bacterial